MSDAITSFADTSHDETSNENTLLHNNVSRGEADGNRAQSDVTGSRGCDYKESRTSQISCMTPCSSTSQIDTISNDIEVKKEEAQQALHSWRKSKRFTPDEDRYLQLGIENTAKVHGA